MREWDRTWVEVDLDAIRRNYAAIRRAMGAVRIMTVLKADAYGHGISGILPACDAYTDSYAVATAEEGALIRRGGSEKPVLIFGPVPPAKLGWAAALGLTFTVGSPEYARELAAEARSLGLTAACHLKIDTGLNRTGIRWREDTKAETLAAIEGIFKTEGLKVTGTYTHFACPESPSEEDRAFTQMQFSRFREVLAAMERAGLPAGVRHCCATGGAIAHPEYRLDMVRLGMMVYGQCDTLEHAREIGLAQAMCWKGRLVQLERLSAGESVSYGRTFRVPGDMLLGVAACGYADGYRRSYQAWGQALFGGRRVSVLGRVCMDYLMLDLTNADEARVGDEVVLLGRQGGEEITAMEIAEAVQSTCGEVTAAISGRVPRYYLNVQEGKSCSICSSETR